ncbi:MAG: hypothetical protein ACK5T0_09130 [Vampirovibrionales bacterium]
MAVDFNTTLNQINQAQTRAATYNGISVNNDGSETPVSLTEGGLNFFNRTAWQGAHLKGRAGNGTLESGLDTVLTNTMGWAGYRPNNLASTYDQDRDKYIAAIEQYNTSGNASALTAVGLPVPDPNIPAQKAQLNAVRDNLINIKNQNGQDAGGRNLSVEKYAKNYGEYLSELNTLQSQNAKRSDGVIDAQILTTAEYAKQEKEKFGGENLSDILTNRVIQLKKQFPDDAGLATALDATVTTFQTELKNSQGTGIAGQVGNEKLAYSRAVTALMKTLDDKIHEKSKGTRSQNVLDGAFKGDPAQKDVANLITAVNTLSGGTDLNPKQLEQKTQNRYINQGFARPDQEVGKIYALAEGDQASKTAEREKVIKDFGNGKKLVLNPDGKTYLLSSSYDDKTDVRTTTSRLYKTDEQDAEKLKKSLAKAKNIDEGKLASTGTIFIQKQNDKNNDANTEKGKLYSIKANFSSKSKKDLEKVKRQAFNIAKAETKLEKPQALQPIAPPIRQVDQNVAGSVAGGAAVGAGAGATILGVPTGGALAIPGAIIGGIIGGVTSGVGAVNNNKPGTTTASTPSTTPPTTATLTDAEKAKLNQELTALRTTLGKTDPRNKPAIQNQINALEAKLKNA